jgi:hypothetical protein
MGETRNTHNILVGEPEGKGPLGRCRRRWEDDIQTGLNKNLGYSSVDWIQLAQDTNQWQDLGFMKTGNSMQAVTRKLATK